jgi:hypothetical protein
MSAFARIATSHWNKLGDSVRIVMKPISVTGGH